MITWITTAALIAICLAASFFDCYVWCNRGSPFWKGYIKGKTLGLHDKGNSKGI